LIDQACSTLGARSVTNLRAGVGSREVGGYRAMTPRRENFEQRRVDGFARRFRRRTRGFANVGART